MDYEGSFIFDPRRLFNKEGHPKNFTHITETDNILKYHSHGPLWLARVIFTAADGVRIPAGEVDFHTAYLHTNSAQQAVIDYFYVPWMYLTYCTAFNLFPVR